MEDSKEAAKETEADFYNRSSSDDINASRAQVLSLLTMFHWDDLEFMEKINDLTYSRKVQLKSKLNKN